MSAENVKMFPNTVYGTHRWNNHDIYFNGDALTQRPLDIHSANILYFKKVDDPKLGSVKYEMYFGSLASLSGEYYFTFPKSKLEEQFNETK